jgi:hypothetical protein
LLLENGISNPPESIPAPKGIDVADEAALHLLVSSSLPPWA